MTIVRRGVDFASFKSGLRSILLVHAPSRRRSPMAGSHFDDLNKRTTRVMFAMSALGYNITH